MRNIIVTGANKGIGRALVTAILQHADDTFVFLGSRDAARGAAARDLLVAEHPAWAGRIAVEALDVAHDGSVNDARAAVQRRLGEGETLYGLVNNAGVGLGSGDMKSVLDVNARGVRRVTEAFASLLAPAGGRVVNITSASGPSFVSQCSPERQRFFTDPAVNWAQLEAVMEQAEALATREGDFEAVGLGSGDAYGLSKACANSYTLLFAREHPHLHVNACTPGFIETDLTRHFLESSGRTAQEVGMKAPEAGTKAPMFLLFGELEGNARYYGSDAQRSPFDRYRSPGDPPYDGR